MLTRWFRRHSTHAAAVAAEDRRAAAASSARRFSAGRRPVIRWIKGDGLRFGYWWKWFPERVRPDGPEWILDGDMVISGKPAWFESWVSGHDPVRIAQDDRSAVVADAATSDSPRQHPPI